MSFNYDGHRKGFDLVTCMSYLASYLPNWPNRLSQSHNSEQPSAVKLLAFQNVNGKQSTSELEAWACLFMVILAILLILIWNGQNELTILNVLECE